MSGIFTRQKIHTGNFTLIEMLAVIAIISILASMLSLAVKNAYDQAMAVPCGNNLRQLGIIYQQYAATYRVLPYLENAAYKARRWPALLYLAGLLPCEGEEVSGYVSTENCRLLRCPVSYSYFKGKDQKPALRNFAPSLRLPYKILKKSKGLSSATDAYPYFYPFARITNPSKRICLTEADTVGIQCVSYYPWPTYEEIQSSESNAMQFPHCKTNGSNVVHFDGHVRLYDFYSAWEKRDELTGNNIK